MSRYVLDTRTFIEVNETLYVLVRFKENTVNYVCEKCDLHDKCYNAENTLGFFDFCNSNHWDDRWFFKDLLVLDSDDKRKFIHDIREFIDDVEKYYL